MVGNLKERSLQIDADKCRFTSVSESSVPHALTAPPSVDQVPLCYTDELRYLGVILDPKLSWHANTQ